MISLKNTCQKQRLWSQILLFLAWIDVREVFNDEEESKEFFRNANLTMVVGSYFVKDGEGFIRLNIGCPKETLNEALSRIKETYKSMYCQKA